MTIDIQIEPVKPEFEPIKIIINSLKDFNMLKYVIADSMSNNSGHRDDIENSTVEAFKAKTYRVFDEEATRQRVKGIKGI